jgi:hypothetical protein
MYSQTDVGVCLPQHNEVVVSASIVDKLIQYDVRVVQNGNSEHKYAHICVNGRWQSLHRYLLGVDNTDPRVVDHVNFNTLDNRYSNLRLVSRQENQQHRRKVKERSGQPTTSKYKGVRFNKSRHKWEAQITMNRKHIYLGLFNEEIDAACAYNNAAAKLFGEFSVLNKVN